MPTQPPMWYILVIAGENILATKPCRTGTLPLLCGSFFYYYYFFPELKLLLTSLDRPQPTVCELPRACWHHAATITIKYFYQWKTTPGRVCLVSRLSNGTQGAFRASFSPGGDFNLTLGKRCQILC